MAKVIGPLHSAEARGAVSSLTYNTWRGISTVKTRSGPTTTMSDAQKALRALTKLATLSWQSLTDAQRAAWSVYSDNHLEVDWTGNPQRLSGYNWYVRINVRRQLVYLAINPVPPTDWTVYLLQDLHMWHFGSYTYIFWTVQMPPLTPYPYIECYGVGPHSAGANPSIKMATRLGAALEYYGSLTWPGGPAGTLTCYARPLMPSGVVGTWTRVKQTV